MKKRISTVITDLDNTLYDWFDMWYHSFSELLRNLVAMSGISQAVLEAEIRKIFQKYGTSEYRFLIEEIPSLMALNPNENLVEKYQSAIQAYRDARKAHLRLYPSVMKTLMTIKDRGCLIVAYTESMGYYSISRVKRLHVDGILDYLYSPEDHKLPDDSIDEKMDNQFDENHELQFTKHLYVPKGEYKPNPKVLLDIIDEVGAVSNQTIYVGDNLMKDIGMAQDASITDVFAKYGAVQNTDEYKLLQRVSYWPEKDVQEEGTIKVQPTYILEDSFSELLHFFEFVPLL